MNNHRKIRYEQLRAAQAQATHTHEEWLAILDAANGRCARCGQIEPLTKDHIKPLCKGGDDGAQNLQAICHRCNAARGPSTTPETIADRIRQVRADVGEDTVTFGARFDRSPRTVEDWEQGRRHPDRFALRHIENLERSVREKAARARYPPRPKRPRQPRPPKPPRRPPYPARVNSTGRPEYEIEPGRWVSRQRISQLKKAGKLPRIQTT